MIRTSGEERLSNFLLWQCAYSEFYFTPFLFPDFTKECFDKALEEYARRDRRMGGNTKKVKFCILHKKSPQSLAILLRLCGDYLIARYI